jgi:shikimate kinase
MKNIALTGLMGSGKSTIGLLLAQKLNMDFVDIDAEIEEKEGISISQIFAEKGESFFREIEKQEIQHFVSKSNQVISTGGGAVQKAENIKLLQQNCIIIYLKTSAEVLFARIKNDTKRPLLQNTDPLATLKELLQKRQNNYQKADIIVDTDEKTIDDIINEIIKNVKS